MELNNDNYFSIEADQHYMSNSQYKGFLECEAKQMAILNRNWEKMGTTSCMQVGNYVHAWNESKLDKFKEENTGIFLKSGDLRSEFRTADKVIEVISQDDLFMKALSGEKEVIMTAELYGTPWKILIDSYLKEKERFGDLKVLKSLYDKFWDNKDECWRNVFEYRGYYIQMAIYAEIERLANNRDTYFEPFIAVVTKETCPDKAIISFVSNQESVQDFVFKQLHQLEDRMSRILDVKSGRETPTRCERCDYCKSTKRLTGTRHYTEFNLY